VTLPTVDTASTGPHQVGAVSTRSRTLNGKALPSDAPADERAASAGGKGISGHGAVPGRRGRGSHRLTRDAASPESVTKP